MGAGVALSYSDNNTLDMEPRNRNKNKLGNNSITKQAIGDYPENGELRALSAPNPFRHRITLDTHDTPIEYDIHKISTKASRHIHNISTGCG